MSEKNEQGAGTPKKSRARERSPNYPSISLPDAVAYAQRFWASEKRTAVPADVAAKAMGYASLSGKSRMTLAALKQYGLVKGRKDSVQLTDTAVAIIVHPVGSSERQAALRAAATKPDLFVELATKRPDASDVALRAYLITERKFSEDGARRFIKSYRQTMKLVEGISEGYSEEDPVEDDGDDEADTPTVDPKSGDGTPKKDRDNPPKEPTMPGVGQEAQPFDLPIPLIGGGMATLRMPRPITGEDYDHMVALLESNLKALRKALVKEPKPPQDDAPK